MTKKKLMSVVIPCYKEEDNVKELYLKVKEADFFRQALFERVSTFFICIGLGLVAFLVHSAGDTNLYSLPLAALFWLSAGVLLATVRLAKANA